MSAIGTSIVGVSRGMLPQKIWNLEPLKSLKMLPILSVIGKKAHNFSHFFCHLFLLSARNIGMSRYDSAGNAIKILVLPVRFFLSEIDNSVTCFCFYYAFY